jgi:hypothetical protein
MRWLPILLVLAISAPVQAETSYAWGDLHDVGGLSSVRIERCTDAPCWARVIYSNVLGSGPLDHATMFEIDGVVVGVTVEQGLNRTPDAFVVRPPPGFYALPPEGLLVNDNARDVIEIFPGSTS